MKSINNSGNTFKEFFVSNRNFFILWIAQVVTLASTATINVLVGILSDEGSLSSSTKQSVFGISLIILVANMPSLFFAPVAGVVSDNFDRRKIMFLSNIMRFFLVFFFIIFKGWHNIASAYILIFFLSVILQFFIPAEGAMIPILVEKKYILFANSLFAITSYSSIVVGAAIAGVYLNLFGKLGSFVLCGIMFIVSGLLVLKIKVSNIASKQGKKRILAPVKILRSVIVSIIEGVKYVNQNKILQFAIGHSFLIQSFVLILLSMIFEIGRELFGVSARMAGAVVLAPAVIGLALGFSILNTFGKNNSRIKLIFWGVILGGISLLIAALFSINKEHITSPELFQFISFFFLVLLGFSAPFLVIPAQTLLHENTQDYIRGRVLGIWSAVITALSTIPSLLFGFIADRLGKVSNILLIISLLAVVYSVILFSIKNRVNEVNINQSKIQ